VSTNQSTDGRTVVTLALTMTLFTNACCCRGVGFSPAFFCLSVCLFIRTIS